MLIDLHNDKKCENRNSSDRCKIFKNIKRVLNENEKSMDFKNNYEGVEDLKLTK